MAINEGRIRYGIEFNVNTASLNNIKKAIHDLQGMTKQQITEAGGSILPMSDMAMKSWTNDLGAMRKELGFLEKAFEDAFNPKLGTVELNKFNQSLQASGTSAQRVFEAVSAYGTEGAAALLNITTNMLAVDRAAKQTYSTFQKLGDTMMNTIRWSLTSTAINTVTGAIQKAYHYTLDLDESLNDIVIVTDKSATQMEAFAREANKAAKSLGATTLSYTDAALIFYQQGLSDEEAKARTETTLKAANITGQSAETVSDQLTAVWNGYKVSAEETELYIDKLSAVAATTAADLEELSTGMSKVASAANIMGVDIDQLNGQIATVISVTKQAPETVGTAFKTIYARMGDIEAGLDTETTLGEYTSQMAAMGFNVLDANGQLRDMGAVIEEIGGKWQTLSREQQIALSQVMAGTRQYNNLLSLFDNWDMYQRALNTSLEATGTLTAQNDKYLQGTEAHLNQLQTAAEGLYSSIFKSDEINPVIDGLTQIVTLIDELVQSLGGMPGLLSLVGMISAKAMKHSIADMITKTQENKLNEQIYKRQLQEGKAIIEQQKEQIKGNSELEQHLKKVLEFEDQIFNQADNLTDDQWNSLQKGVRAYNESVQQTITLQKELEQTQKEYADTIGSGLGITLTKDGKRKATEIGGKKYYLSDEKDDEKTGRLGLASARKRKLKLEEKKTNAGLTKEQKKELEQLNRYIPLAEKENKIIEKKINLEKHYTKQIQESTEATDEARRSVEEYLNKTKLSNVLTDMVDTTTTAIFSTQALASSFDSLFSSIATGDVTLQSLTGNFLGLASAAVSMIPMFSSLKTGLAGVKAGTITGAAAWSVYWSAATMGAAAVIAVISTVVSAISSFNAKQAEDSKTALENAQAKEKEIQANIDLANSYLNLYEVYKQTGEASDELNTASEQIIATLDKEGYAVIGLINDYDALAAAVQRARRAQSEEKEKEAVIALEEAKNLLDTQGAGSVAGVGIDWISFDTWAQGVSMKGGSTLKDEGTNREILLEALGPEFAEKGYDNSIDIKYPKTAEGRYEFYKRIQKAQKDPNWTHSSKSEFATGVRKILEDEELKAGAEAYEQASKTILIEKAFRRLDTNKPNNIAQLTQQRETEIKNLVDSGFYASETEAAAAIDEKYNMLGSNVKSMLTRSKWITSQVEAGNIHESQKSSLASLMSLDSFSEADYAALGSLNVKEYSSAASLISAAKKKAKWLQEEAWASKSAERLSALDYKREEIERKTERATGKEKARLILEQNKNLEQQREILKDVNKVAKTTLDTASQDFEKLAIKEGAFSSELKAAFEAQDWETLQNEIEKIGNSDVSLKLQNSLIALQNASNSYLESQSEINDMTEDIYQNKIEAFEAEIEYLENLKSSYESLLSTLQNMAEAYRALYGENSFTSLQALYSNMQAMSLATLETNKQIFDQQLGALDKSNFYDGNGVFDSVRWEKAQEATINAANDYVSSINEYITLLSEGLVNNINAAFETSAKEYSKHSLDYIDKEWEYRTEQADKYFDEVEKAYEIQSLERKVLQDINKLTNKNAQYKINTLLEEQLEILKTTDKLSEADITRAEQKIALLQAEIELEESRNKSVMRLQRSESGEYRYQYVADEQAQIAAQERRDAAARALYQSDKNAYEANLSEFNELRQSFAEEYSLAKDADTKQLIMQRYTDAFAKLVQDNTNLLATMSTYDQYDTNSPLQQWISGLAQTDAAGTSGLASLMSALMQAAEDQDYSSALDTANGYLHYISEGIRNIAEDAGITLPAPSSPTEFNSGGYTGSWGDRGRLAVLHEKEIVLNKDDTFNLLKGIDILRRLDLSMLQSVAAFKSGYELPSAAWELAQDMGLEQNVYITAEFPDATNRDEIQAAFDNLVNLAAQHAYINNKK